MTYQIGRHELWSTPPWAGQTPLTLAQYALDVSGVEGWKLRLRETPGRWGITHYLWDIIDIHPLVWEREPPFAVAIALHEAAHAITKAPCGPGGHVFMRKLNELQAPERITEIMHRVMPEVDSDVIASVIHAEA